MMIKSVLMICSLFWIASLDAQERIFVAKDSIPGKYTLFSVDNFGRVYLGENDVVYQYYNQNDSVFTASLKSFRPTIMESSKSFRTLVFDSERSVVRFYDNTLTDINGEIDLVGVGIQQPVLVAESFAGNTFWVLDAGMMRLVKVGRELQIISQTENLIRLFDNEILPSQMLEYNDFLYILVPNKGVAIFDVFGTFIKLFPTQATCIGALNNYLLLQIDNQIQVVSNDAFLEVKFSYEIPPNVLQFLFSNDKVYFLQPDQLLIGSFEKK